MRFFVWRIINLLIDWSLMVAKKNLGVSKLPATMCVLAADFNLIAVAYGPKFGNFSFVKIKIVV